MGHLCREHWHRRRLLEYAVRSDAKQSIGSTPSVRITTPNQNDVLLGRGKAYYTHVGNSRLRCLIVSRMSRYQCAPRKKKHWVSESVIDMIHERGGRFLKGEEAWWLEVDRGAAQKKVSDESASERKILDELSCPHDVLLRYPCCSVIFVVSFKTERIHLTDIWLEHKATNIRLECCPGFSFPERPHHS
jgi:hypothetical protein